MSAFTEPLAQVRIALCNPHASLVDASAALDRVERLATDMEKVVEAAREVSRIEATGVLPDFMPLYRALCVLSAREEGTA